jgi:hypothetical protein
MLKLRQLLRRKALIAFLFTTAVWFFSPTIVMVYWHLRYGSIVVYRDKRIPVPSRWIVEENVPQELQLMKLPMTVLGLKSAPTASLSRGISPKVPMEEKFQSFQAYFWTYVADGGAVSGPIRFGKGADEGYCMISSPRDPHSFSNVQCDLFRGTWFAIFLGEEKDVGSFLQIVRQARSM